MNKTAIIISIAIALAAVWYVVVYGKNDAQAPIVDPQCEPGYELVGEGCIPAKEACELGGDQYYFDESKQECLTR